MHLNGDEGILGQPTLVILNELWHWLLHVSTSTTFLLEIQVIALQRRKKDAAKEIRDAMSGASWKRGVNLKDLWDLICQGSLHYPNNALLRETPQIYHLYRLISPKLGNLIIPVSFHLKKNFYHFPENNRKIIFVHANALHSKWRRTQSTQKYHFPLTTSAIMGLICG